MKHDAIRGLASPKYRSRVDFKNCAVPQADVSIVRSFPGDLRKVASKKALADRHSVLSAGDHGDRETLQVFEKLPANRSCAKHRLVVHEMRVTELGGRIVLGERVVCCTGGQGKVVSRKAEDVFRDRTSSPFK